MMIFGSLLSLLLTSYRTILEKVPNIIVPSARESVDHQLIEMSGRDTLIRSQVVFCCDYEIVLNQNLVQDVQGLSSPYTLKKEGPKNYFVNLIRPQVELNHHSGICLWGIWPLEICGHKITIFCYATCI